MFIFSLALSLIAVFFIPGFIWSYVFFDEGEIRRIERAIITPAVSFVMLIFTYTAINYFLTIPNATWAFSIILLIESSLGLVLMFKFSKKISNKIVARSSKFRHGWKKRND